MTSDELLAHIRDDVLRDTALPQLWSDDLIFRFLTEAQQRFCRQTYALLDDTTTIDTEIGVATYPLHKSVLFVSSARVSTNAHDMSDYTRRFLSSGLAESTGTPNRFTMDESSGMLRVYPVPDAVVTINLRVARLPLKDIVAGSSPEIPVQYRIDLAEFVAYRCLLANDVDGSRVAAAENHRMEWERRVSAAKREYYRIRSGINPNATSSWTGKRN